MMWGAVGVIVGNIWLASLVDDATLKYVLTFFWMAGGILFILERSNRNEAITMPIAPEQHAVAVELDRLMFVIESAVRAADPLNHPAVVALLKANRAALAEVEAV